jgi:hypothetical protein
MKHILKLVRVFRKDILSRHYILDRLPDLHSNLCRVLRGIRKPVPEKPMEDVPEKQRVDKCPPVVVRLKTLQMLPNPKLLAKSKVSKRAI